MRNEKPIAYILPNYFWEALVSIHREYFGSLLDQYLALPEEQQREHVFKAFQVMDCYLDVAFQEGWFGPRNDMQ